MGDSLFDSMQIKLEDARDDAPIMVALAGYMEFSSWVDQQLDQLRSDYPDFETRKSQRMNDLHHVLPNL